MSEEKTMEENTVTEETPEMINADVNSKATDNAEEDDASDKNSSIKLEFCEDEIPSRRFFNSRKEDMNFLRDKWILSRIKDEDLMEYLRLEQKRNDQLQHARDVREKRIMTAFELTVSLAAAVIAIYFLKDNPTLLTNIIYICGILGAFWLWKNSQEK